MRVHDLLNLYRLATPALVLQHNSLKLHFLAKDFADCGKIQTRVFLYMFTANIAFG
jgi:hypothetical protein